MNPVLRNRLIGLAIAVVLFAADQAYKAYILGGLQLQLGQSHYLLPIFNYTLTHNYGVSLGMFTAESDTQRWILVAVTGAIAAIRTVWMLRERKMGDILGLSLILGGALGNIKDRYELGYVVDFLDLHFGDFRPFMIFNLADAAITIGVVIILARSLLIRDKAPDKAADTAQDAQLES